MNNQLKELCKISSCVGNYPDLVQGGGGNTSVKINNQLMIIKASGFELRDITENNGFTIVNYKNIIDYYNSISIFNENNYEQQSLNNIMSNVIKMENYNVLRPSIETGFHSLLKKYVIHTHSVYANILCCCKEGSTLIGLIFDKIDIKFLWIPFRNPGFDLTLVINDKLKEFYDKNKVLPDVLFLENHGLVVTSDECDKCMEINNKVNKLIKGYFYIKDKYPIEDIVKYNGNSYKSTNKDLIDYFKSIDINQNYFDDVIFPDQVVYFDDVILGNESCKNKICIDMKNEQILYSAGYKEAKTINEILTAYVFIRYEIERNKLNLSLVSRKNVEEIENMEGEKYRKNFIKEGL